MNSRSKNPGPSGSGNPALRSQSSVSVAAATPDPELVCGYPGCGREFTTKTGKGLHQRRAHPDWMDAQQNTAGVRARWNEEETLLLARKEVDLTLQGVKFINQAMQDIFPGRTLESIKGKRKQPAYKALVQELLKSIPSNVEEVVVNDSEVMDFQTAIADFVKTLPLLTEGSFDAARLQNICNSLGIADPETVLCDLALYLREVFPNKARKAKSATRNDAGKVVSKRALRRAEYARVQDLWRKNRKKCIRMLLDDITEVRTPPEEIMVPFWKKVMTEGVETSPGATESRPVALEMWRPISFIEIRRSLPANTTSAGPDGLTARLLKKVPLGVLCRILNIIMWCGKAPASLLESVTSLIPKKSRASLPGEFRPITVSSVLVRTLHKVLATRMATIKLDQRQRAFRQTDGCSDNVFLLDMLLRLHHKSYKPLFIASLDIAKAFDSVAHKTIVETLRCMGLPTPMIDYIADVYSRSATRLNCNSWTSEKIKPTCGVKQGDPMSPVIFNMVIERLLKALPDDIGARIGGLVVNAAAFADDMLLFATTPMGLQKLLDTAVNFLNKCGLRVNASKCLTVSIKSVPREKKTVIDSETVFECQGRMLPALRRTSDWKYLGVPFTPEGRAKLDTTGQLRTMLEKLTKAPMKPQQRLFALRTNVVPGLYHQLELGCTNISMLRKCDRMIRHSVRQWLALPTDAPNAYIHANVKDGGLGVQSLRWQVPLRRLNRIMQLPLSQEAMGGIPKTFLDNEIRQCQIRLLDGGSQLTSGVDINSRWAKQLFGGVDGHGLKESARVPQQHQWIQEGTRFLTGRDFVQSCKLRINALPTKSRLSRGRPKERLCRAGCNCSETLNHVLQQCHRTHGPRIKRHDAVASYVARSLEKQEYRVAVEPKIQTDIGLRKPDIIAWRGVMAIVIDAQVVNDQMELDQAHRNKIQYYGGLTEKIKELFNVREVKYTSITLSWRGVWSEESAKSLTELGLIKKRTLKVLSSRVVIGGLAAFHQFNKMTTVRGRSGQHDGPG